ncbi:TetR/AcrR family transcriptional regulator [Pseudomonas sp. TH49]|uniref:TetR/AcrR family transcriptional regulator n=1 Tax=Pseudomonas sp. TH49 TaxID=2796413 RepID=UPI001911599A|nr:TetR/AcrR family transcriptional regulator [Pseudomonas sp. TH49]MBK5344643.1 TetR/AcrR family transcriptional regulator [Pseudomonas sp. TH49]
MSGLRERQKEQRKEAILVSAMKLFETGGYAATTVEQIASDAGVSAPTVFNYFGSKQEILLSLVERAERSGASEALFDIEQYDNAVDALCAFHLIMTERELQTLPIPIWRELLSQSFDAAASKEIMAINGETAKEIATFLRLLQSRGLINSSVDVDFFGSFMSDFTAMIFARLVQTDYPDYQALELYSRKTVEMLFNGLHP